MSPNGAAERSACTANLNTIYTPQASLADKVPVTHTLDNGVTRNGKTGIGPGFRSCLHGENLIANVCATRRLPHLVNPFFNTNCCFAFCTRPPTKTKGRRAKSGLSRCFGNGPLYKSTDTSSTATPIRRRNNQPEYSYIAQ